MGNVVAFDTRITFDSSGCCCSCCCPCCHLGSAARRSHTFPLLGGRAQASQLVHQFLALLLVLLTLMPLPPLPEWRGRRERRERRQRRQRRVRWQRAWLIFLRGAQDVAMAVTLLLLLIHTMSLLEHEALEALSAAAHSSSARATRSAGRTQLSRAGSLGRRLGRGGIPHRSSRQGQPRLPWLRAGHCPPTSLGEGHGRWLRGERRGGRCAERRRDERWRRATPGRYTAAAADVIGGTALSRGCSRRRLEWLRPCRWWVLPPLQAQLGALLT